MNLQHDLMVIAKYLEHELISELIDRDIIASEDLKKSVEVKVLKTVEGLVIQGRYLYYGRFVETGRRAKVKRVPIDALIKWIKDRKINLKGKKERDVAFAIQHGIWKKGIKPRRWQTETIDKNENRIAIDIEEIIGKTLSLVIENMITRVQKDFKL